MPYLPGHLSDAVTAALGEDPFFQEFFAAFFEHRRFSKSFAGRLIAAARGRGGETWKVRCVAALMLQHQVILARGMEDLDFVLARLGLKAEGLSERLRESVLEEGYTTTDLRGFVAELRHRLSRHDRIHARLRGRNTSREALLDFLHLARQECKLTLARYLFSPADVVRRILTQVKVGTGAGTEPPTDGEAARTLSQLPAYEADILSRLLRMEKVFWVADSTSSRLSSLVEYPLGTVVLVIKPPGSDLEFEIKRAGLKGKHPIKVIFWEDGETAAHVHRFYGVSVTRYLKHESWSSFRYSTIHSRVHGSEAAICNIVSIASKHTVPVAGREEFIFDYLTSPELFGEGFPKMRRALGESVAAFDSGWGSPLSDLEGELLLTMRFLNYMPPGQAVQSGTSSFRLDLLARYLSAEGPRAYFEEGLGTPYSREDARRFADEVAEEVLGLYTPPALPYRGHEAYLRAAFAVPENRARAERHYLSAMGQIGLFWGTLLALRGYSKGESFVPRNVGLRSVWQAGAWEVRMIFMDHDNLQLPDHGATDFYSPESFVGMRIDESYIFGIPDRQEPLRGTVDCLGEIYRVDERTHRAGLFALSESLRASYRKTQDAILSQPDVERLFHDLFRERLRDWDELVAAYLDARDDPSRVEAWRERGEDLLRGKGYDEETIDLHLRMIVRFEHLLARYELLYRPEA